jgi:hypothetical protein
MYGTCKKLLSCVTPNNPPIRGFPSTLDVKVWISIFVKAGLGTAVSGFLLAAGGAEGR